MPLPPGKSRLLRHGYLASNEQVLLETHPSKWWYFVGPVFWGLVVAFFDYIVAARASSSMPWAKSVSTALAPISPNLLVAIAVVINVAWLVWLGIRTYDWAWRAYVVTDDRIIQQDGIVRHVVQEIPIRQIRDVDVFQASLWARAFHYGNLRFKSLTEIELPQLTSDFGQLAVDYSPRGNLTVPVTTPDKRLETIYDPRDKLAMETGVEWWVGVPDPFAIERLVESRSRAPVEVTTPTAGPAHPWPRG